MRLTPILILESRKNELYKKYSEKFQESPETLDFILGISDLEDTNFKYGDFVLKSIRPSSSSEDIEEVIELVKNFDRFKSSLEEKDINRYDLDGLKGAIENHLATSKSQLKKQDTPNAQKIYEDSNILIVKPLTYEASCKYGAGTRWCTTTAGQPSYFKSYTAGDQVLYYVILKKFDINNKFYKIAIHKNVDNETWYDATDERMTDREKEVFNLGAPKVIETIREYYQDYVVNRHSNFIKWMFNPKFYKFNDITRLFHNSEKKVGLEFKDSFIPPVGSNEVQMLLNISVDEDVIDEYLLMITYRFLSDGLIRFSVKYNQDYIDPEFDFNLDLVELENFVIVNSVKYPDSKQLNMFFNKICDDISVQVAYKMKINTKFVSFVNNGKTIWYPNRIGHGYTFKRQDSGLIKKLTDYLESGTDGTKLDFLVDAGSLDKKEVDGKILYSLKDRNEWRNSSTFRGKLSNFFNSAKSAGILDYDKRGNQFYLKKGPNFDKFKDGQLEPV